MSIKLRLFVLLSAMVPFAAQSDQCSEFVRTLWTLKPETREILRSGQSDRAEILCKPFPITGRENVRLEILDQKGQIVFEKPLFLDLDIHFDFSAGAKNEVGKIFGGSVPAKQIVMISSIPEALNLGRAGMKIRVISMIDSRILGEGRP